MNTTIFIYADFFEKEVFTHVLNWAEKVPGLSRIIVATTKNRNLSSGIITEVTKEKWFVKDVLALAAENCVGDGNAVFAFSDCPFYDEALTKDLLKMHEEYAAEYTFADGYPFGFVPEVLAYGTVRILKALAEAEKEAEKEADAADSKAVEKPFNRESIFSLIKSDINSFEVETLLSPEDFRLYRLDFSVSTKRGKLCCEKLESIKKASDENLSVLELCKKAVADPEIFHTVPAFYNIQIAAESAGKCIYTPYPFHFHSENKEVSYKNMKFSDYSVLLKKIADFSGEAVISFSLWGEALLHPEFNSFIEETLKYPGISVLIETSGIGITEDLCRKWQALAENAAPRLNPYPALMWIVELDAVTQETYSAIHPDSTVSLEEASAAEGLLRKYFPNSVWAQFIRINQNENELEEFFLSHDNRLIQKYDDFAGILPPFKPTDLSPAVRNPCWHLMRDFCILADGSVPLCREYLNQTIIGNVFSDEIEEIWKKSLPCLSDHLKGEYCGKCKACDEYYTFNF